MLRSLLSKLADLNHQYYSGVIEVEEYAAEVMATTNALNQFVDYEDLVIMARDCPYGCIES